MVSSTSCCGSLTGRSLNKTWSRSVKIAVFAPMPRARVRTATAVKPGVRASMRKVYFRSRSTVSSQPMMFMRRGPCLTVLVTETPGQLEVKTNKVEKNLTKFRVKEWGSRLDSVPKPGDRRQTFTLGQGSDEVLRSGRQTTKRRKLPKGCRDLASVRNLLSRRWLWQPCECQGLPLYAEKRRRRGQ